MAINYERFAVPSLAGKGHVEAIEAMVTWFYTYFEDPSQATPRADGDWLWVYGGPYDAGDELHGAFGGAVDEDWIQGAVEKVLDETGIDEWAPGYNHPNHKDAEEEYHIRMAEYAREESWLHTSDTHQLFRQAIEEIRRFVDEHVDELGPDLFPRMAFVQSWSVLEAYLSARLMKLVSEDEHVLNNLYTGLGGLKDRTFSGYELAKNPHLRRDTALEYFRAMSFHNTEKITKAYGAGLHIRLKDEIAAIEPFVSLRHDCVHRNGQTTDGERVFIGQKKLESFFDAATSLVQLIEKRLGEREDDRNV